MVEPPEKDPSSGKLESIQDPGQVDQCFWCESVVRVNTNSLLKPTATTSSTGTLYDTDLIMENNNNYNKDSYDGINLSSELFPHVMPCGTIDQNQNVINVILI